MNPAETLGAIRQNRRDKAQACLKHTTKHDRSDHAGSGMIGCEEFVWNKHVIEKILAFIRKRQVDLIR